jgi:spermidine synthase
VHPVMSLVPDHRRVLILGGGDGIALREVLKYSDVESVTLVDIDPGMVSFCRSNDIMVKLNNNAFADARVKTFRSGAVMGGATARIYQETDKASKNKRKQDVAGVRKIASVEVIHIDADKFIGEMIGNSWNIIIIDFPDPNSIELAKLYSKEFYLKAKRILAENGMIAIQATSPYHAKETFLCILRTMEAAGFIAIPYHDNVPSFGDWGWFLAAKDNISKDAIGRRIEKMQIGVATRYITPDVFQKALVFGKDWLSSAYSDINTLMNPVVLRKYINESWKLE